MNDNYNVYGYFNNEISRRTIPLNKKWKNFKYAKILLFKFLEE